MEPILLNVQLPFSYWQERDPETGAPLRRPDGRLLARYLDALCREIRSLGADMDDATVGAVHFAGGYMSLLSPDEFTAVMAALHRSFRFVQKPQVSGVLFPGSLDMALISVYGDAGVAPLMFEVPSLLARECERLALPNALQALDQTVFLMQNFGVSDFGLRLPVGIGGRDEGAWRFMLGQIRHYQPRCVQFVDVSGGRVAEHPAFARIKQALAQQGLAERAPNLLCAGETPRFAQQGPCLGVGLGAISRLDGYETRNTAQLDAYLAGAGDYRNLIVSVRELDK